MPLKLYNKSGTTQVGAPLKVQKTKVFYICQSIFQKIINFTVPNYTDYTIRLENHFFHNNKGTTKPLKKLKIEDFFRNLQSRESHSAEKIKRGTLWDILNIRSVAKYLKIEREKSLANPK